MRQHIRRQLLEGLTQAQVRAAGGHNRATALDVLSASLEAYTMPTEIKPPQENENNRPKVVALVFVALLVVGCVWLFNSLNAANDKLNCVASGRRDCDQIGR
jgi:hypothetical protein